MQNMASPRINDFVIKIASVNGTGSASANNLLMKSIFRSGIPVMGKNYFPSNIQGLPTWYEIRVSKHGHVARSGRVDIMVAMNAETYARDPKFYGATFCVECKGHFPVGENGQFRWVDGGMVGT